MTAIMLTRIDNHRNMARFYKLDIQPTLFGEWSLVREWGRIGRPGTVASNSSPAAEQPTWHLLPSGRRSFERIIANHAQALELDGDQLSELGCDVRHRLFRSVEAGSRGEHRADFPESFIRRLMHDGNETGTSEEY